MQASQISSKFNVFPHHKRKTNLYTKGQGGLGVQINPLFIPKVISCLCQSIVSRSKLQATKLTLAWIAMDFHEDEKPAFSSIYYVSHDDGTYFT